MIGQGSGRDITRWGRVRFRTREDCGEGLDRKVIGHLGKRLNGDTE